MALEKLESSTESIGGGAGGSISYRNPNIHCDWPRTRNLGTETCGRGVRGLTPLSNDSTFVFLGTIREQHAWVLIRPIRCTYEGGAPAGVGRAHVRGAFLTANRASASSHTDADDWPPLVLRGEQEVLQIKAHNHAHNDSGTRQVNIPTRTS